MKLHVSLGPILYEKLGGNKLSRIGSLYWLVSNENNPSVRDSCRLPQCDVLVERTRALSRR
jgi:hypothetical protein